VPAVHSDHQLVVAADLKNLAAVREFVQRAATASGLEKEATAGLILAVDEAVANIIVHGYGKDDDGRIEIRAVRQDRALAIHLRDDAPAYNPLDAPVPALDKVLEDRPVGGMGVLLIRQNTDGVYYRPRNGRGNQLTLVKNLG